MMQDEAAAHAPQEESSTEESEDDMYETMDDSPVLIEAGLFIGSFFSEQNISGLKQSGITHVLQVSITWARCCP